MHELACSRDDLMIEMSVCVPVGDAGEADLDGMEQLSVVSDEPYWCANCGEGFRRWDWALEHVKESKVAT